MGAASEAAWQGARGTGETEQAGVVGALRASPAAAGTVGERLPRGAGALLAGAEREIGGTIRGARSAGRFRDGYGERVSLGKAHSEAARGIESKAGEFYREGLEGLKERAREAAKMDGFSLRYRHRDVDWYRLKRSVSEERMEQVREIDGEQAYEKMMRAVEKASQEKAMQVERARQVERSSQLPVRKRPERRGPERGGPERDYGPSR